MGLIEKLKTKTAYELLFEEEADKSDLEALLQLSESEIREVGLSKGFFQKIRTALMGVKKNRPLRSSSNIINVEAMECLPDLLKSKGQQWSQYFIPFHQFVNSLQQNSSFLKVRRASTLPSFPEIISEH